MHRAERATRVLILSSGLGSGHVRAAQAIAAALKHLAPDAIVRELDFWSLMNPGVADAIKDSYLELVLGHPDLYARIHRLDERTWRRVIENDIPPPPEVLEMIELLTGDDGPAGRRSLVGLFEQALGPYPTDLLLFPTACAALPGRGGERTGNNVALLRLALLKWVFARLQARMEQRLVEFAPDVVVATQMVPAALVSATKRASPRWRTLPLIGVLTDFGAHDYWAQPGIDLYCLPHPQPCGRTLSEAHGAGIVPTGVPLMPAFERPPARAEARHWLGLAPSDQRPVILVLGGGLGLGVASLAAPLAAQLQHSVVVVMAGRNAPATRELLATGVCEGSSLVVRGWTDCMERHLAAADLVVGKPGGVTVAEALACGRPMLVANSLQGQESFNVQFLERERVGRLVPVADLAPQVSGLLAHRAMLTELQRRAWNVGQRDGARQIATRLLQWSPAVDSRPPLPWIASEAG
jgi:processive 1,2-diacylglycerol beta-glucosyltransferase